MLRSLSGNHLGAEGVAALAPALAANGTLTSIDLAHNSSWTCDVKGLGCLNGGLRRWKSTPYCNWDACDVCYTTQHGRQLELIDSSLGIIAIADALRVNGALTKLSLANNKLEEEGTKAICEALEQNTTLKELDISGGDILGFERGRNSNIGGTAGVKHVAKMLGVNGALTKIE